MEEYRELPPDGQNENIALKISRAGVIVDPMPLLYKGWQNNHADLSSGWNVNEEDVKSRQNTVVQPALAPVTDINGKNNYSLSGNDISMDLLDQKQSKEQAKLLQRFKQLKDWQKQQQEKLIYQQQQQLDVLRSEQQRVQSMLAAQRHKQWGGGINVLSPGKQQTCGPNLTSGLCPSNGVQQPAGIVSFSQTMQPHMIHNLLQTISSPRDNLLTDLDSTGEATNSDIDDGFFPLPETSFEICHQDAEDGQKMIHFEEKNGKEEDEKFETADDESGDLSIKNNECDIHDEPVGTGQNDNTIVDFDNQPVAGKGKQFEELLEQQLKLDAQRETSPNSKPQISETQTKRTFLKRGQGISRFGMKKFRLKKKTSEGLGKKPGESRKGGNNPTKKSKSKIDDLQTNQISRKVAVKTTSVRKSPLTASNKLVLKPQPKSKNSAITKTTVVTAQDGTSNSALRTIQSHNHYEAKAHMEEQSITDKGQSKQSLPIFNDTLEVSFQNKVQEWQVRVEEEKEDLDEFETLEQAADDNASFSSNASLVVNVMKRAALKRQKLIEESQRELRDVRNGRDPRAPAIDVAPEDILQHRNGDVNQVAYQFKMKEIDKITRRENEEIDVKETRRMGGSPTEEEDEDDNESNDTLEEDDESETEKFTPKMKKFSAGLRQSREFIEMNGDEEDEETSKKVATSSHALDIDFDDDESWGEFAAEESSSDDESIIAGAPVIGANIVTNKNNPIAVSFKNIPQGHQSSLHGDTRNQESAPSTAELSSQLFPTLVKHTPEEQIRQQAQLQQAHQIPLGQGVQSKLLRDKLSELETEIERFRRENAALAQLRTEREKDLKVLKNEVATFEKQKTEELKSLEEFKKEEMKKLKKERRNFEKYQQAMKTMPDKKGREEIESLKDQLSELQEELSNKERRWTASSGRLRKRIEVLETENNQLRDEIKVMEQKRLESLKKDNDSKKILKKKKSEDITRLSFQPLPEVYVPTTQATAPMESPWQQAAHLSHQTGDRETADSEKNNRSMKEGTPSHYVQQMHSKHVTPTNKDKERSQSIPAEYQPRPSEWGSSPMSHPLMDNEVNNKEDEKRVGDDETENSIQHPDGKVEHVNKDGSRVILFKNGTRKDISSDGETITVTFFNGDIKQILPDQRVVYYYQETQTTHTTYQDGLEILQFANNQTEKHYPDGTKEITFPDQTIKYLFPNGREESMLS
ncbi:centromere protein J-like [Anneissia japonica]|uniref:centromere protein J-like n=1 Tax=Anneissia japonica TaxID=1529436 RepID=UPI00142582AA|nr:centromere protein J-like [Anneissia japonica]